MGSIIFLVGLFSGIGVFLSTMYALSRAIAFEAKGRLANGAVFASVLAIMAALFFAQSVPLARLIAPLAFIAGAWSFWVEERWFKVFPAIVMLFAVTVALGYVASY
ncbi:MAG: hypothetical protein AAGK00_12805 [Pseudomonadota bacterium]